MLYVLDTHVLIWYFIGSKRLHKEIREKIDSTRNQSGRLLVPTIVLAEALDIFEVKKIIEKSNFHIKETCFVKEIGIFGSFVKGKQSTKSDIDILVVFVKGHKDFFNFMRLKYYLEELLKLKVDLVIKEAVKPGLKERIFNEAEYV